MIANWTMQNFPFTCNIFSSPQFFSLLESRYLGTSNWLWALTARNASRPPADIALTSCSCYSSYAHFHPNNVKKLHALLVHSLDFAYDPNSHKVTQPVSCRIKSPVLLFHPNLSKLSTLLFLCPMSSRLVGLFNRILIHAMSWTTPKEILLHWW